MTLLLLLVILVIIIVLIGRIHYPDNTELILISYMIFILIIFSFISVYLREEKM